MAKKKGKSIKGKINRSLKRMERNGWIKRTPAFLYDYEKKYPFFKDLEANHEIIKKEVISLLAYKDQIMSLEEYGGKNTKGGIHAVKWKSFVLKSGKYIEKNCQMCPETYRLLKKVPRIKQAFFSILEPEQHIKAHKGYYYGFLRYHLGVIIPNNNQNNECWIRINENLEDNEKYDKSSIIKGEKYYWREGEGIMFNDNYLHEAANESEQVRVVFFLDVVRKYPIWIDWLNRLLLYIAYNTKQLKKMAKNAEVNFEFKPIEEF